MKDYCPKTCDMCSQLPIIAPIVIQSKCEDKDGRCPSWARYTDYKCPTNFLKDNCAKSCKICTAPSFAETPNHNYGAVIIDGGFGIELGSGNGCPEQYNVFLQRLVLINSLVVFLFQKLVF